MKRTFLTLLAAAAIALTGCIRKTEPTDGAFIVYGKIYTAEIDPAKAPDEDGRYKMGEAMVIKDGKFVYVGDEEGADRYRTDGVCIPIMSMARVTALPI